MSYSTGFPSELSVFREMLGSSTKYVIQMKLQLV
jgi:hypothetical protein